MYTTHSEFIAAYDYEPPIFPEAIMNTDERKARDLMHENVLVAYEGWTIQRLADFFIRNNITAVPVIASDHQLVGVVSVTDVFHFHNAGAEKKQEALLNLYHQAHIPQVMPDDLRTWADHADKSCTVHQIMTPEIISVDLDDSVRRAARLMVDKHIHRVFVTQRGAIVGVITAMDVLADLVS